MDHVSSQLQHDGAVGRLRAYLELTKPRIATLLLIATLASFFLAEGGIAQLPRACITLVVTALLAAGIAALNQYLERDRDALMRRTADRPLPSGRVSGAEALAFGLASTAAALAAALLLLNPLSAAIGLFTAASYLLVYTPLKRVTAHHTSLGAFSGATPPLLGWAAARGSLGPEAWLLFGILFLWQFPHFLAIDLIYREDYERAGILVLPVVDRSGRAVALEILASLSLLLVATFLPLASGLLVRPVWSPSPLAGLLYGAAALLLDLWFLSAGIRAIRERTEIAARRLLRTSVLYLPLLMIALIACSR